MAAPPPELSDNDTTLLSAAGEQALLLLTLLALALVLLVPFPSHVGELAPPSPYGFSANCAPLAPTGTEPSKPRSASAAAVARSAASGTWKVPTELCVCHFVIVTPAQP